MKERPILFSAPMVRALLDGTKTQTRRLIKPQPEINEAWLRKGGCWDESRTEAQHLDGAWQAGFVDVECKHGQIGDRLWVKEAITFAGSEPVNHYNGEERDFATFLADGSLTKLSGWCWKRDYLPGMFMPRGLSRITLEITDVHVQRLQDISEKDAQAEGVERVRIWEDGDRRAHDECGYHPPLSSHVGAFAHLWDGINGVGAWDANPWVWALTFKRVQP